MQRKTKKRIKLKLKPRGKTVGARFRLTTTKAYYYANIEPLPFIQWSKRLRYDWWKIVIYSWFGDAINWRNWKHGASIEEQRRVYRDMIETYCMGGEL